MNSKRETSVDFDSYLNLEQSVDQSRTQQPSKLSTSTSTLSSRNSFALNSGPEQYPRPSFHYSESKQHAGFVPGAYATMQATANMDAPLDFFDNETSADLFPELTGYEDFFPEGFSRPAPSDELTSLEIDSATSPTSGYFQSPSTHANSPLVQTVSNSNSASQLSGPQAFGIYPGMHMQAARAAGQLRPPSSVPDHRRSASQRSHGSQLRTENQVRSQQNTSSVKEQEDLMVQARISRLLAEMRQRSMSSVSEDGLDHNANSSSLSMKKDEEDMDEDERLLASEEGKKLSSKERRQLRNKVSARAFRSRRKEYITQLESEVTAKSLEVDAIKQENVRLKNENKQLTELTRMLLSQPAFSGVLSSISAEPSSSAPPTGTRKQQTSRVPSTMNDKDADITKYDGSDSILVGMATIPESDSELQLLSARRSNNVTRLLEQPPSWMVQSQVF